MFKRNIKIWVIYIVLCVFVSGCYLYSRRIDEYRESVLTKAQVIDKLYSEGRGRRTKAYYYPQYQFRYNDSDYITADHNLLARNVSIGDRVTVIFKKDNPGDATIFRFVSYWIPLPYFFICLSIAAFIPFVAFVIGEYFKFRKEWAKK